MTLDLAIDQDRLGELCRRSHVATLELFGSRAKRTARPDREVDLLVTFGPGQTPGWELVTRCDEVEILVGHTVDVLTRAAVEASENRSFTSSARQTVVTLHYAA